MGKCFWKLESTAAVFIRDGNFFMSFSQTFIRNDSYLTLGLKRIALNYFKYSKKSNTLSLLTKFRCLELVAFEAGISTTSWSGSFLFGFVSLSRVSLLRPSASVSFESLTSMWYAWHPIWNKPSCRVLVAGGSGLRNQVAPKKGDIAVNLFQHVQQFSAEKSFKSVIKTQRTRYAVTAPTATSILKTKESVYTTR